MSSSELLPYMVLVVDADAASRERYAAELASLCFVQEAASVTDARALMNLVPIHIVLVCESSQTPGLSFCASIAQEFPDAVRLMYSDELSPDALVAAINDAHLWHIHQGPFRDHELSSLISRAIEQYHSQTASVTLVEELRTTNESLERKAEQRTRELISLNEELRSVLDRMQALVITDELTGLYNRRMLLNQLDSLFKQSQRYQVALSCVVCDLIGFKSWNEEHGHDAGNAILREVAARIHARLRGVDIPCRAGGDTFTMILPHTNSAQARIAAERLYQDITQQPFIIGEEQYYLDARFGIAEVTSSVTSASELFRRAEYAEQMARQNIDFSPIAIYPDPENSSLV